MRRGERPEDGGAFEPGRLHGFPDVHHAAADRNESVRSDGRKSVRSDGKRRVRSDGEERVRSYGKKRVRSDRNKSVRSDGVLPSDTKGESVDVILPSAHCESAYREVLDNWKLNHESESWRDYILVRTNVRPLADVKKGKSYA